MPLVNAVSISNVNQYASFFYMAMLRYTSNSITWMSKNIPECQNVEFSEAKIENILMSFISIHDKIYAS